MLPLVLKVSFAVVVGFFVWRLCRAEVRDE